MIGWQLCCVCLILVIASCRGARKAVLTGQPLSDVGPVPGRRGGKLSCNPCIDSMDMMLCLDPGQPPQKIDLLSNPASCNAAIALSMGRHACQVLLEMRAHRRSIQMQILRSCTTNANLQQAGHAFLRQLAHTTDSALCHIGQLIASCATKESAAANSTAAGTHSGRMDPHTFSLCDLTTTHTMAMLCPQGDSNRQASVPFQRHIRHTAAHSCHNTISTA